jgi:non-homologous end joining protein Ku
MIPRSIWTGHLKISLLTIPIHVYAALNEADKITFNQLHKDCHQRLKQNLVCPIHGKKTTHTNISQTVRTIGLRNGRRHPRISSEIPQTDHTVRT